MRKAKKIFIWLLSIFAAIGLLLSIVLFISFKVLNHEAIKSKILISASKEMGATLKFQQMSYNLFPQPNIAVHQASLVIPDNGSGTLEVLKIYPAVIPLFTGDIRIKKLGFEHPVFNIVLPEKYHKAIESKKPLSFQNVKDATASVLSYDLFNNPGLTVIIKNGRLNLFDKKRVISGFSNINANLTRKKNTIHMGIRCNSSVCDEISLKWKVSPGNLNSKGSLHLKNINHQVILNYFFPNSGLAIKNHGNYINLTFNTPDGDKFQADMVGDLNTLTLIKNDKKLSIMSKPFSGSFKIETGHSFFDLSSLSLEYPKLNLAGIISYRSNDPLFDVKTKGSDININDIRELLLFLWRDQEIINEVCRVVKGGEVPTLHLVTKGKTLSELITPERLRIEFQAEKSKIFVPEARLDLMDGQGDLLISKGFLIGKNLNARLGDSLGSKGELKLGLMSKDAPFHMAVELQADLSQLPPILQRVVPDQTFQKELSLVKKVEGQANGKLILSGNLNELKTTVDVFSGKFSGEYKRIPFPIGINNIQFYLDHHHLVLRRVHGSIGNSALADLNATVQFNPDHDLNLKTDKIDMDIRQLHQFLLTIDKTGQYLGTARIESGRCILNRLEINGPFLHVNQWNYNTSGELQNLAANDSNLAGPLSVSRSHFVVGSKRNINQSPIFIYMEPTTVQYNHIELNLNGNILISENDIQVDMDLLAEHINKAYIEQILEAHDTQSSKSRKEWLGYIRLNIMNLEYFDLIFSPVRANLYIKPNNIFIDITQAELCGIPVPGNLTIKPSQLDLSFTPYAKSANLSNSLSCLWNEDKLASGSFDLTGKFHSTANHGEFLPTLNGDITLFAKAGRIYRIGMISKIFAVLNVTEIFRGNLPDLVDEGFAYNSVKAQGNVKDGQLLLKECIIDGSSMTMAFSGKIDLVNETLDLSAMVAPFKTIDSLIKYIPVIKGIFNGHLITIPFAVKGSYSDYQVIPLHPKEVGTTVLGLMKRTLKAPIDIFQPVIKNGKKNKSKIQNQSKKIPKPEPGEKF